MKDGFKFRNIIKVYKAADPYDREKRKTRRLQFGLYLLILVILFALFGLDYAFLFWFLIFPAAAMFLCGIRLGSVIGIFSLIFLSLSIFVPNFEFSMQSVGIRREISFLFAYLTIYASSFYIVYTEKRDRIRYNNHRFSLEDAVKAEHDRFQSMMTQTITSISNAVDARDSYTLHHSVRVAEYSVLLAKKLGFDSDHVEQLRQIALLHDIGKIGISDTILNKKDSLTREEYEMIKQHTVFGGEILKDLSLLPNAAVGAVGHHERWDGKGYPYGLKEKQIPDEARIIAIADAFDSMNSSRIYRKRMPAEIIMKELKDGSGTQFDPELLEAFLPIAQKIMDDTQIMKPDGSEL